MLEQEESKYGTPELYNLLKDYNYEVPDTIDEFHSDMQDEENLASVHNTLTNDNHDIPDLGTLRANIITKKDDTEDPIKKYKQEYITPPLKDLMANFKMPPKSEVQPGGAEQQKQFIEQQIFTAKRRTTAINNQLEREQKKYGSKFSDDHIRFKTGMYNDMIKDGNLMVTKDDRTGKDILAYKDTNIFTSYLDTYNKLTKQKLEDDYLEGLSVADKIEYEKIQKERAAANSLIETKPSGFPGKSGEKLADITKMFEKPVIFSIGTATGAEGAALVSGVSGPAITAGVAGMKNVGNTLGFMLDMASSSYKKVYDITKKGILQGIENPTYEQEVDATERASKAASQAKAVGAATGAIFGIPMAELPKGLEEAASGYLKTLASSGKHALKDAAKFATATTAGSIAEGEIAKQYGSGESQSQIFSSSFRDGFESLKFPLSMFGIEAITSAIPHALTLLANKKIDPSFKSPAPALDAKAKSIASKLPENVVTDVFNKAEENNILPKGTGQEVLNDIKQYKNAENQVPKTVTNTDAKDALAGKIEKIDRLEQEYQKTKIDARKKQIEQELSQLKIDADNIYNGGDVLESEHDIAGNPLKSTEPLDERYTQTEEGKALDEQAKELGYDNVTHAINAVNEALGTDYKTFQEIRPEEFIEADDVRHHNKAFEETVKGTEYEKQTGDIEPSGETATGTTTEIPGEPPTEETVSHADIGYANENDARVAYESDAERGADETYEEWKWIKHCGEI